MDWQKGIPIHEKWVIVEIRYTYEYHLNGYENLGFDRRMIIQARYDIGKNQWIPAYSIFGICDHIPIENGLIDKGIHGTRIFQVLGWQELPNSMEDLEA